MEGTQQKTSCFARMLDVRTYVLATRAGMARADAGGALFMMAAFGLVALILFPIWVSFDLLSTWDFTTGLRQASEGVVAEMAYRADGFLGMSVGALLAGVIFTGFTLLPSLFELAFPTVNHPMLNLLLLASIVFDYVTDWGKAAELTAGWTANPVVGFFYTAAICAFVSVFVQAILVCCLTVVGVGAVSLVSGANRRVQAVVIDSR